jgi:hypothetical protein
MVPTLDITGRLNTWLREQGNPSVDFIVALLPDKTISASLLRQALSGNRSLENKYYAPLEDLLRELRAIATEHAPYPIRWTNPVLFRELLTERRREREAKTQK